MGEFRMPSLGADMTEGTLTEWLVQPGDHVRKGDIVAVVDTAKADIEVECFETGVVERLLVPPGTLVPVGTALAVIGAESGAPAAAPEPAVAAPPSAPPSALAPVAADPAPATHAAPTPPAPAPSASATTEPLPRGSAGDGVVASPLIRHLALERGVDLAGVLGTGPGGRVVRADVLAAAARRPSARVPATPLARRLAAEAGLDLARLTGTGAQGAIRAADVRSQLQRPRTAAPAAPAEAGPDAPPASRPPAVKGAGRVPSAPRADAMRRAVGELMSRSKREIPHYYLSTTVDLSAATDWLRERNLRLPVAERLVPAALLLKAAACAAREVPQLNGFWTGGRFAPAPAVHLGVAVSLRGGGLVAPAIHDAADLPLPEIMAKLRDLVARARSGRLRGSETADPTITVTSLGEQGVEAVFGVIYPPQVALVGLGRVVERPWAVGGMLGVRPVVTATLSADHRATDGATGARYLTAFDRLLQRPEEL